MSEELWQLSAGELARRIASRRCTSADAVEAHLQRIATVNPHLNAVTVVLDRPAREAAQAADRAVAEGRPLGPLHGVPFTVKENIDVAGSATTMGVTAFADAVASVDAPIVERMRAAGAIPIARTNLPDMGLRVHTVSSLRGLTRNPWHPGRTAGGSSGGEAAAIASGASPLGLGNDIGGSLRNPAHCCGITSLKPTTGRLPRAMTVPALDGFLAEQLMLVDGPMARHVADLRLALGVLAGPHPRDPFAVPVPLVGPRPVGALRVAVMDAPPGAPTEASVRTAVDRAAGALADAGFAVAPATPPQLDRVAEVWGGWLMSELRTLAPLLEHIMGPEAVQFIAAASDRFPEIDLARFTQLLVERHTLARAWAEFFTEHDVLLCPVWTRSAFEHGWDLGEGRADAVLDLVRCVYPGNLLGLPAAVVPADVVEGLPIGVQLVAGRFREDFCLEAAEAIESALGRITPIDPRAYGA